MCLCRTIIICRVSKIKMGIAGHRWLNCIKLVPLDQCDTSTRSGGPEKRETGDATALECSCPTSVIYIKWYLIIFYFWMLTLVLYCRLFFEFTAAAPDSHTRTGSGDKCRWSFSVCWRNIFSCFTYSLLLPRFIRATRQWVVLHFFYTSSDVWEVIHNFKHIYDK